MTLEERLTEDMKAAMRDRDELRLSVIRMLRGQILLEKKKGTGMTAVPDDVVTGLVRGHVKRLREALAQAEGAGRTDLAERARAELQISEVYLPAEMPGAELEAIVQGAVAAARESGLSGPKATGQVMKSVMEKVRGRADGKRVGELVRRALEEAP